MRKTPQKKTSVAVLITSSAAAKELSRRHTLFASVEIPPRAKEKYLVPGFVPPHPTRVAKILRNLADRIEQVHDEETAATFDRVLRREK